MNETKIIIATVLTLKIVGLLTYMKWILFCCMIFYASLMHALEERHLILIAYQHRAQSESAVITEIEQILVNYGFDNRSIAAVFVPPVDKIVTVAEQIAEIGFFTREKIHPDKRLALKKNVLIKRQQRSVLQLYDEIERTYPRGHVIFMADNVPLGELIEALTQTRLQLRTGQAYVLPLVPRRPS